MQATGEGVAVTTTAPPIVIDRPPHGPARWWLAHARFAAAVALVLGVVVTALGAGIGIRRLTKTGLTWTALIGLLMLVAGLSLLAYAWRVFWRATHRWQRLWFVPVVLVALLTMSSIAQGGMLAYAPRNSLGSTTPAVEGLTYRDVTFRTSDGVRLSAWFIPSVNHAAVVTMPGSGSNRSATLGQATVLARHGYGVLMVDPRGQGRSGGHAMDAGWYGDRDLTAAVTFLQRQPGVDATRIGVLGLSMGGEAAIGAAAADPAIRAVVTEGATGRTAADKAGYLPGGVLGAIQRGLDRLTYGTAALLSPAPQPGTLHRAIGQAQSTAFLLIAGSKAVDEADAVGHLRTAAPGRVQTWTVAGATHTHGLATAPQQWTTRVVTFLDHALGIATR
ncbi:MAG TPA: alpha/beta fold hydrolase [Jatrophihabitans sp.]|nr:alpha/beta fold hydrolase [Jatrophihabitans sp.]